MSFHGMNLGVKPEPLGEPVGKSEPPKTQYPSFILRDEKVDELKAETGHECAVDDYYTAEVRLRVSAVSNGDMGKRLEFEVVEMDDLTPEGGDADETDESATGDSEPPGKKPPKALRYS